MIPYFQITTFSVGPLEIKVWGLAVALGLLVAILLGRRLATKSGLNPELLTDLAIWVIVPALVFSRIGYMVLYNFDQLAAHPWSLIRFWEGGMSSFGGYVGAAVGFLLFSKFTRQRLAPYAEMAAFVFPLGYGIGRIGCFLIHDHPGVPCECLLAVAYPGGARLDHGLLLSLVGFIIFVFFLFARRRYNWRFSGNRWRYTPLLLIIYGGVRLVLDFFRIWDVPQADNRLLLLTPAQYGSVILIGLGIYLFKICTGKHSPSNPI